MEVKKVVLASTRFNMYFDVGFLHISVYQMEIVVKV